jgi:hypothetical protein
VPTSRKASVRAKRNVKQPTKYRKDYPIGDATGHHYNLRAVPRDIWKRVRRRAEAENLSVRYVVIRSLELYALGRLNLEDKS